MNFEQGIAIAVVLFLASALQSAIGFAFVLFALPFALWLGLPLSHAVVMILLSVLVQVSVGAFQLRQSIRWGSVFFATALRYLALPLGLFVLYHLDAQDPDVVKQVVGLLVLISLAITILGRVEPRESLHKGWGVLAFSASGFLQGIAAVGGPPLVLWVMAHKWSNEETRSFLFACFLLSIPFQIAIIWATFGDQILGPLGTGLLLSPLVALGSAWGVRLGNQISKPLLRTISYAILALAALFSVLAPWILP